MSCIVTDHVGTLSSAMAFTPTQGATVLAWPATAPSFVKITNVWYEQGQTNGQPTTRSVTTDAQGQWSFTFPDPTEVWPSNQEWVIQLPNGDKFQGLIPTAIPGPLTLHDLVTTYAWKQIP